MYILIKSIFRDIDNMSIAYNNLVIIIANGGEKKIRFIFSLLMRRTMF